MTTLPQIAVIDDIIVFPDDLDCNLFYLARSTPRVRMDGQNPVFNGLFWTDNADGSTNSTSGLAGGYINFDINLAITEQEKEKVRTELKKMQVQENRRREILNLEKERLTLRATVHGESNIPNLDVPRVGQIVFSNLEYTGGTVTLLEEKDGDFVAWSSAGGPASLIGDNNAAFSIRLSADGAAIWYHALEQGNKAISIRYDLKFRLRLPSLEIRAWAGSRQKSEIHRKVERVWRNTDQGCKNADVERINVKSFVQNLTDEGLVNIEIKKGATQISDEHVSQLRNLAIKIVEDKVQEVIKSRIHGLTEEERKSSMIEIMEEEITSFVELRFTQRDVVEWPIAPQTTIMNFLEEIPEENKKNITKIIDLANDIVGTVEIPISVNAPWDEEPNVSSVKVMAKYPSAEEQKSWLFQKGNQIQKWFFRRPEKDNGIVKYTSEVYFKGVSDPLVIDEQETNGEIHIEVGNIGLMKVKFKPHPILNSITGDNKITHIQVDLNYKDIGAPGHFKSSIIMTPDQIEGIEFKRVLYKNIDAPIIYTLKYFGSHGKVTELPQQKFYTQNQAGDILIPSPFANILELDVELGMTPDESLQRIIVDFKYEDRENDFSSESKVFLMADWKTVTTRLVLIDREKQNYKYQYRLIGNNMFYKSSWIDHSGNQTIWLPIFQVIIDISRLKVGEKYHNVLLEMKYAENGEEFNHQFFLHNDNSDKPLNWYIPRKDSQHDTYSYSLTLFPKEGEQIEIKDVKAKGKFLIVQDVNTPHA